MTDKEILSLLRKFNPEYVAIKTGLTPEYIREVRIRTGQIKGERKKYDTTNHKKRAQVFKANKLKILVEQINKVNKMKLVYVPKEGT